MIFSRNQSNSLKDFHSQGFSSNSTNNINSISFLSNEIPPNKKNVSSFVNVMIFLHPSSQCFKSFFKISIKLLFHCLLFSNIIGQLFSFSSMRPFLSFSLLLKISSSLLLSIKFSTKFRFSYFKRCFCPSPES